MLKHIYIVLLVILSIACGQTKYGNVTIRGTVANGDNEMVYLQRFNDSLKTFIIIDSSDLSTNQFEFKTFVDSIEFLLIGHKTVAPIELIVQKDENISLNYDLKNIPNSVSVEGSEHSATNIKIYQFVAEFENTKKDYSDRLNELGYTDTLGRQSLLKEFEVERSKFQKEKANLFAEHENSPATHVFLPYLNPENELNYFQQIERTFAIELNNTVWHKSVKRKLEEVENYLLQQERFKKQQEALKNQVPGGTAPEISLQDPYGNIQNLSDLRGKYVLIDFWASWCRPCRAENPNVVRLYNKYKSKGFDIFSVSLDNSVDRWKAAIEQDGLIWNNHVSDLLGWKTSVVNTYGFSGIPYTVLIDKEGKIIASKLRGASLEAKLKEIFGS